MSMSFSAKSRRHSRSHEGKVKVLAVTDKVRASAIPEVPTTAEVGLRGLLSTAWFVRDGRSAQDEARIAELDCQGDDRGREDAGRAAKLAINVEPVGDTPAEMAAFVKEENHRWGEVILEERHRRRVKVNPTPFSCFGCWSDCDPSMAADSWYNLPFGTLVAPA
jgi:tripartite-type tricarboxylate transporter receptor subunit TctC